MVSMGKEGKRGVWCLVAKFLPVLPFDTILNLGGYRDCLNLVARTGSY